MKAGVDAEMMTRVNPAAQVSHMVLQGSRLTWNIPRAVLTKSILKVRLRFVST